MAYDEEEFTKRYRRERELVPNAVVERRSATCYSPEVAVAGAHWVISEPHETHDAAMAAAEAVAEEIRAVMLRAAQGLIAERHFKKAKA